MRCRTHAAFSSTRPSCWRHASRRAELDFRERELNEVKTETSVEQQVACVATDGSLQAGMCGLACSTVIVV